MIENFTINQKEEKTIQTCSIGNEKKLIYSYFDMFSRLVKAILIYFNNFISFFLTIFNILIFYYCR